MLRTRIHSLLAFVLLTSVVYGDMDMDMGEPKEFHAVNAGSKSFHLVTSLAVLLIVPSFSACFALANEFRISTVLQIVTLSYSAVETLFLNFPDPEGHENRTSKGTSWFLTGLLGATVFTGTVINGTNIVINKWKSSYSPPLAVTKIYKTLSILAVLTGWVRVCLAPIALLGFCYGRSTGQCIAHGIMGSSFVGYGFVLALVLVVPWIRNHHLANGAPVRSQEFWDSSLMCLWGIVNTFTEHRWGRELWSHGDFQHTLMGIIWWCGGMLGMWLSWKRGTRNVLPAVLLIYTGYAMSEHSQHLKILTKVHAMFGLALIVGGISRIIEICFLLRDAAGLSDGKVLSFQHVPPLLLVLSGILFMAANEEQLHLVHDIGADHSLYILVVCGAAFLTYLWMLILLAFYLRLVGYNEDGQLANGYDAVDEDFETEMELDSMA